MKNKFPVTVSVTFFLLCTGNFAGARTGLSLHPLTVNSQIAAILHENLDEFVRSYQNKLRRAKSIEDLRDFLPVFRMKKFDTEYSAKQRKDWLSYRKQMPRIGKLISKDIRKDRAFLLYETKEQKNLPNGQRRKTMAEITLIKEGKRWKIFLEHFRPAKQRMFTSNQPSNA